LNLPPRVALLLAAVPGMLLAVIAEPGRAMQPHLAR
jgi:hypothetical protein